METQHNNTHENLKTQWVNGELSDQQYLLAVHKHEQQANVNENPTDEPKETTV